MNHADVFKKSPQGRGRIQCKDLKARLPLSCWRTFEDIRTCGWSRLGERRWVERRTVLYWGGGQNIVGAPRLVMTLPLLQIRWVFLWGFENS